MQSYFENSSRSQKNFSFNYDPSLQYEWVDKQNVKLTWRKAPLNKNFYSYEIQHLELGDYTGTYQTSINDTVATIPLANKFGTFAQVILTTLPQGGNTFGIQSVQNIPVGKSFPSFYQGNIVYNKTSNKYFALQSLAQESSNLIRIDGTSFQLEATLRMGRIASGKSIALSENGQYLYVSLADTIKEIDQNSLSVLSNHYFQGYSIISVSNTNLIATNSAGGKLIKMPEFTVIQTSTNNDMVISPSGNYLNADKNIWKWNGASFDLLASNKQTDLYGAQFENDQKLIIIDTDTVKVFDLSSFTVQNKIPVEWYTTSTVVYDPTSGFIGRLLSTNSGESGLYYLYNSDNSQPVKIIDVGYNNTSYGVYDIILNNNMICSNGCIVPLSFF
ncbi:MAG TPA: hypothetical protein DGG95_07795 [Cytophagales bacterium]|nr:hypothetical protein [Cytophagales bacterium]